MDWRMAVQDGVLVGQPRGRVDESSWQAFSDALTTAVAAAAAAGQRFVVDLSGVDYMSSRGLRALSTGLNAARAADVPMALAAPGDAMVQILAISRYDKLFAVHPDVATATAN